MHLHLPRSKLLTFPELRALICDKYSTGKNFQPPPATLLCWRNKTLRDFHFFSFVSNLRFLLEWTHLKEKAASECHIMPAFSLLCQDDKHMVMPPKCIPISPPSLHQNLLTGLHADFPASGACSTLQSEVPCFKSLRASLDLVRNAPVASQLRGWNPSLLTVFPKTARIEPDSSSDHGRLPLLSLCFSTVLLSTLDSVLSSLEASGMLFPFLWLDRKWCQHFQERSCRVQSPPLRKSVSGASVSLCLH